MTLPEIVPFVLLPVMALGGAAWYVGRLRLEAVWVRRQSAEAEQVARLRLQDSISREREVATAEAARRSASPIVKPPLQKYGQRIFGSQDPRILWAPDAEVK